jgi:hypothetical protein
MQGRLRSLLITALLWSGGCVPSASPEVLAEASAAAESTARALEVVAASAVMARVALALEPTASTSGEELAGALAALSPCVSAAPVSGRVAAAFGDREQACALGELSLRGVVDVTQSAVGESLQLIASVDPQAPLSIGNAAVLGAVILIRPPEAGLVDSDLELQVAQGRDQFLAGKLSFLDVAGELTAEGSVSVERPGAGFSLFLSGVVFAPGARAPKAGVIFYDDGAGAATLTFAETARGVEVTVDLLEAGGSASFLVSELL